ncbi:MAG: sulfotransferase [Pseudohongiellaceae bacterium]
MTTYLVLATKACILFGLHLLRALPAEGWRHVWKRLPLFVLLWLGFVLLSILHLLGFLSDELLFADYRNIDVERPVFIIGIPRSGTTFLHRTLTRDQGFTSLSTWEVIFAPSVSERYLYSFLGKILFPLGWLIKQIRLRPFRHIDKIHPLHLQEPEEDFILLLWIRACFLQALICPNNASYWRLASFDDAISRPRAEKIMAWYKCCLQKHLFYHGAGKRILSKNPSFTSLIQNLSETFPGAFFIACYREPDQAVPSQLSSLRPAMRVLGNGQVNKKTQEQLLGVLWHYYEILQQQSANPRLINVPMSAMQQHLKPTLLTLYQFLEQALPEKLLNTYTQLDQQAKAYRSRHRYNAGDFSLNDREILDRFSSVWPLPQHNIPEQA